MRVLDGEQLLVRIFIGESDQWHHRPLSTALVERLRSEHFAGATVFKAVAGFGARSVLHTTHLLRLSEDLPIVIEVVDTEEHIQKLLPILDEMVSDCLVTLERTRVLKYSAGEKPVPGAPARGAS
jgi:PII-like signaling protein